MEERKSHNIVGAQVRRIRSAAGISQKDLAARCEVLGFVIERATVSHIETGHRGVSDLEMVLLAQALRVDVNDLVPAELPAWKKDTRPPTAKAGEGE